jgi:hypothetical protein
VAATGHYRPYYRIDLRRGGDVIPLGRVSNVSPHPASLASVVSRLIMDGESGLVVLVDEESERDVACSDLGSGQHRSPTSGRTA